MSGLRAAGLFGAAALVLLLGGPGCRTPPAPPTKSPAAQSPAAQQPAAQEAAAPAAEPATTGPQWVEHEASGLRVLQFPPAGATAPLVVAMHGLGDKPEAFQRMLAHEAGRVNLHVPAGPLPRGSGHSWFNIRAAQDDAELAAGVARAADAVAAYIADVRQPGQPVVVTGFSQGGMVSFTLALTHPELVDLALPLGGFLPTALRTGTAGAAAPRIVALHGAEDTRIPTQAAQDSVAWLEAAGFPAVIETYPGVGHGVSPPMRARLSKELGTLLP